MKTPSDKPTKPNQTLIKNKEAMKTIVADQKQVDAFFQAIVMESHDRVRRNDVPVRKRGK